MDERKRILLVDDERQVLFVLEESLRRMSVPCEVITAKDGWEAHRYLRTGAFDLMVTDIRLPGKDGVTLTELARALGLRTPVLWITAHGCEHIRAEAARLDVVGCLEKPVELMEFRQAVLKVLGVPLPKVN